MEGGEPPHGAAAGGGYAEISAAPRLLRFEDSRVDELRGSRRISRSFLTAFLNLFMLADIKSTETALIHGVAAASAPPRFIAEGGAHALDCHRRLRSEMRAMPEARRRRRGQLQPRPIPRERKDRPLTAAAPDVILDSIGGPYLPGISSRSRTAAVSF